MRSMQEFIWKFASTYVSCAVNDVPMDVAKLIVGELPAVYHSRKFVHLRFEKGHFSGYNGTIPYGEKNSSFWVYAAISYEDLLLEYGVGISDIEVKEDALTGVL